MPSTPRSRIVAWLIAALALGAVLAPWAVRRVLWRWEKNPILEGGRVAEEAGCLACHLAPTGGEIPNPGSRWGSVPRFGGGNVFMYVHSADEVEEFIRFGAPRAWLEDEEVRRRLEAQHLRMPAYEGVLTDQEIAALTAWSRAIEGIDLPGGPRAAAGRELAREHGCVACHGVEGAGGVPNPGSLGGFVPGFRGANFDHMVQDREEFAEWVRTGSSERLARRSWVRFFWERQRLSMPAYREELDEAAIDDLWAWIQAARADTDG